MKRLIATVTLCMCASAWLASAEEAAPKTDPASGAAAVNVKPALCPCEGHVLAITGDKAVLCTCDKTCKCTLADDGKKCSCGKSVQTYDLAGKFVCTACKCVSPKEAKCPKCGGDMKAVPAKPAEPQKVE